MSSSEGSLGKLAFLFALVFVVVPVWGESVTAPINHVVDKFEDTSAQSDTLYAESGRTIKPTSAVKAHGSTGSRITVNDTEGSGVVHVADIDGREGDDEGKCLFLVSGIYMPDTTSTPDGGTGKSSGWYTGYENGDMGGTLTLVDQVSSHSASDTGDEDSVPHLACEASDGKGHVEFTLNVDSGSYGWTITEGGTLNERNSWRDSKGDLDPGEYTLNVTGDDGDFQRQIDFTVIPCEYLSEDGNAVMWYPERNYNMTDHLLGDIDASKLEWEINGDGNPSINPDGLVEFGDEAGVEYTITVRHELDEDGDCEEMFELTAAGYKVLINDKDVYDGEHVSVVLGVFPTDLNKGLLGEIESVSCGTKPKQDSQGNPAGTTDFDCDGLGDGYTTNLGPALWYSTQENHCNDSSKYELEMEATIQGHTVKPVNTDNPEFDVYVELGNNFARKYQTWAEDEEGDVILPDFDAEQQDDGTWKVTVQKKGNFGREVKAWTYVSMSEDSQFYDMAKAEEEFHKGQLEGTTSNILDHLYDADEVMEILQESEPYSGDTKKAAVDAAEDAFEFIIKHIEDRDDSKYKVGTELRCKMEKEAKKAAGASHRLSLKCTYDCGDDN